MIYPKALQKKAGRVWTVSTSPAIEPVSVDEVKTFARIDGTSEDSLIANFIQAIREKSERYLWRAFIEQTITMKMDFWPGEVIELPQPPLISITQVATLDEDDTETVYSSSNYFAVTESEPGLLVINNDASFPTNDDRTKGGFEIQYKAGYGTGSDDVPQTIRIGIMAWVTYLYENRLMGSEPPPEVKAMWDASYKRPHI